MLLNAKAPFSIFFAKYMRHLQHISIIISVRYNPTDRKNRPFGLRFLCRHSQYKIAHIGANPQNQRLLHIRSKRLRSISLKLILFALDVQYYCLYIVLYLQCIKFIHI